MKLLSADYEVIAMVDFEALGEETVDIWNRNADYWDERMGEGNDFHSVLIEPAQLELLGLRAGDVVLDVGCGNGQFARKMVSLGAQVVAIDASARMIDNAQRRTQMSGRCIDYRVLDASDEAGMLALGEGRFDAVVCTMALMDIASIAPLASAVARLLKADGRLVFSVMHPCFNSTRGFAKVLERDERDGVITDRLSVRVSDYIRPHAHKGIAMAGQPVAQNYFHRPLSVLLKVFFDVGFVLDGLDEPVFSGDDWRGDALTWLAYKDIPPALVGRMRKCAG